MCSPDAGPERTNGREVIKTRETPTILRTLDLTA